MCEDILKEISTFGTVKLQAYEDYPTIVIFFGNAFLCRI